MKATTTSYHILNGDSLLSRFPEEILGKRLVMRECLIDGPVQGDSLRVFFTNRANFIATYDGVEVEDYHNQTVPVFEQMQKIPADAPIFLWFEDDLFCQLNLWFLFHLLNDKLNQIHLVRPKFHARYGFSYLSKEELTSCLDDAIACKNYTQLTLLWQHYQRNETENLLQVARAVDQLPFIEEAVQAHLDRIPTSNNLGKPKETLLEIMNDLNSKSFGPVFKEFCQRLPNYGFGDIQVKRLFDELKDQKE